MGETHHLLHGAHSLPLLLQREVAGGSEGHASPTLLTLWVFLPVPECDPAISLCSGPACNLFLRLCNFRLGPFEVNKFTSPGVSIPRASLAAGESLPRESAPSSLGGGAAAPGSQVSVSLCSSSCACSGSCSSLWLR